MYLLLTWTQLIENTLYSNVKGDVGSLWLELGTEFELQVCGEMVAVGTWKVGAQCQSEGGDWE